MSVLIGLRLPPCAPVPDIAAVARDAEVAGFHEVFLPDSQVLWRDAFVTAYGCLAATERIRIGTAVSNVVTRHDSVVASLARTLAETGPGRFDLGLGVGNSSVEPVGLAPSRQDAMRAGVSTIRSLLAGDFVDFGQQRTRLRNPQPDVPLLMAASGPKNLVLAGEIADGAILLSGVSAAAINRSRALVEEGARNAGKDSAELRIIVSAHTIITSEPERDARLLKPICAGIAQRGGRTALAAEGIEINVPADIPGVYPDLVHAEDWEAAVEICGEWVSDQDVLRFARAFCLFGSPQEITEQLTIAEAAGADEIFIQHVGSYDLPRDLLAQFADSVLAT